MTTATRSGFELCADNDYDGETTTFVTWGHITSPELEDYRNLMRAITFECGFGGLAAAVRSARWSTGYVGKVGGEYDLLACDETGQTGRYGDDDGPLVATNALVATNVRPVTWATVDA